MRGFFASRILPTICARYPGSFFQSRAAAADGVFYLGGWDNTLYALDAATGQPKWTAKMGRTNGGRGDLSFYYSPAIASPAVGEGRVYVCTDDGVLHAVSAATGTRAIRQPASTRLSTVVP